MTEKIHFTKMHGAGNDYIYVNTLLYSIPDPTAAAIASGNGQHCTAHQYGITWGFGFDIGKQWEFGFTAGYQLNPLFESTNMPRTFNTFSSCKLTYYLL